jgi:hypothetical protein
MQWRIPTGGDTVISNAVIAPSLRRNLSGGDENGVLFGRCGDVFRLCWTLFSASKFRGGRTPTDEL